MPRLGAGLPHNMHVLKCLVPLPSFFPKTGLSLGKEQMILGASSNASVEAHRGGGICLNPDNEPRNVSRSAGKGELRSELQ